MEQLLTNLAGAVTRTVQEKGRTYLVAPLSLIVPGVLSGSKGPLYYPPEEIAANVDDWNGTPMVVYHPYDNGTPISAKDHPLGEKIVIGTVRNSRIDKQRLVAEGWFDIQATKRVDERVLTSLQRGDKIELSTGLYTDNVPAKNGVDPKGRSYAYIARNYRPDHLAILPDQKGACSLEDGCGVLVNEETTDNAWSPAALAAALKARLLRAKRKVSTTAGRGVQIAKAIPGDLKSRAAKLGQRLGLVKPVSKASTVAKSKPNRARPASKSSAKSPEKKGSDTYKLSAPSGPNRAKTRAAALLATTGPAAKSSGKGKAKPTKSAVASSPSSSGKKPERATPKSKKGGGSFEATEKRYAKAQKAGGYKALHAQEKAKTKSGKRASSTLGGRDRGTRATGKSTAGYVKSKDRWYKKLKSKKPTRNALVTNQDSDMTNRVNNCGGKGGTPGPCKGKRDSGGGHAGLYSKLVKAQRKYGTTHPEAQAAYKAYHDDMKLFRSSGTQNQGDNSVKKLTANQRTTIADRLITNGCGCWTEEDREVLNAFDDNKLRSLYKGMKRHNELEEIATTLNTLLAETEEDKEQGMALNAMPAALMKAIAKKKGGKPDSSEEEMDDEEDEGEVPVKPKKKPTSNAGLNDKGDDVKNATASRLTPAEQATLNWATAEMDRQKTELVTKLTANVGKDQKDSVTKTLNAKSLDDLKLMVSLMPAAVEKTEDNRRPMYYGAAAPVGNMSAEQAEKDKEDFLPLPTINWSEVSKSNAN